MEPMLVYKQPNIVLGATPIGTAERTPDRDEIISIEGTEGLANKSFGCIVGELSSS
jgi:hypothetical protein